LASEVDVLLASQTKVLIMKLKKRRREEERSITSFMNEMKKNDYFYDDVF